MTQKIFFPNIFNIQNLMLQCVGGWRLVKQQANFLNDIGRNSLLGNGKKIAKFLMRTFTCRSTFLYAPGTGLVFSIVWFGARWRRQCPLPLLFAFLWFSMLFFPATTCGWQLGKQQRVA
jgi:hypothetical protein